MTAPLLVLAWGNRSRGDDALGPLCVEWLRTALPDRADIEFLDDYQLMVEHALDLRDRSRVLLIDASSSATPPFETHRVVAASDASWSTHALSPSALLQVYRNLYKDDPPACTLLAIRAAQFELGEPPSALALKHLDAAQQWALGWLSEPAPCSHA